MDQIWDQLDGKERKNLFEKNNNNSSIYRTWQLYSNPMPIQSGEFILNQIELGKIRLIPRFSCFSNNEDESGFDLMINNEEEEEGGSKTMVGNISAIINATGISHDMDLVNNSLLSSLLKNSICEKGNREYHDTFQFNPKTQAINEKNDFFIIGKKGRINKEKINCKKSIIG